MMCRPIPITPTRPQRIGGYRTLLASRCFAMVVAIGAIRCTRMQRGHSPTRRSSCWRRSPTRRAIAIENVRLFKELEVATAKSPRRSSSRRRPSEILRVISSSPTDAQPVFDAIAEQAVRLCERRFAFVFRFDGTLMHIAAHHNLPSHALEALGRQWPMRPDPGAFRPARFSIAGSSTSRMSSPSLIIRTSRRRGPLGIRTMLTVPMMREGSPIGAIAVCRQSPAVRGQQIDLLETFATRP